MLLFVMLLFFSCECNDDSQKVDPPSNNEFATGWNNNENFTQTIPVAINYGSYQSSTLPASVDLTYRFPPVGNQGQLGTCVAWAVGYNAKSYLDGVSKNLPQEQLQFSTNQYSPTDLFFAIDQSKRSCNNGTYFDDAFNVLITRGVNTLSNVPYDGVCYQNSPGNPSTASANRIKNYRRIDGSIDEIKQYLAQGIPVVIGAMVNSQFQAFNGSGVLGNLNYTGNEGGHAMIISGYDDSKGAFRIINSWGNGWGNNGYAWVEYNFLVNKFCIQGGQKSLFVAFNDTSTTINPPAPTEGGPDLTAFVTSDYTMYPSFSPYINARRAFFDVKNTGNQTINSSDNWNIYYLWVDAFNANNYGVIFRGEFTTSIPQNTFQNITANYTLINYNLAPGASLGQTIMNLPYISWDYYMPMLNGNYYLVLFIDKGNSNDINQTNNVFYVTQTPKYFMNGYSNRNANKTISKNKYRFEDLLSFKHKLSKTDIANENIILPYRNLKNINFKNGYTSEEIVSFLEYKIKNGGL